MTTSAVTSRHFSAGRLLHSGLLMLSDDGFMRAALCVPSVKSQPHPRVYVKVINFGHWPSIFIVLFVVRGICIVKWVMYICAFIGHSRPS